MIEPYNLWFLNLYSTPAACCQRSRNFTIPILLLAGSAVLLFTGWGHHLAGER